MAVRQKGYCVFCEGLSLNIGRVGNNIGINWRILQQEVNTRLAVAVIRQVSRSDLMPMLDKNLGNMPAAATRFPYIFREAFEL